MSWNNRSPESNASSSSPSSNGHRYGRHSLHIATPPQPKVPPRLIIKSKFDSEFRRFSFDMNPERVISFNEFRGRIEDLHSLHNIPFTLCYTSNMGDLLPITNDEVGFYFQTCSKCLYRTSESRLNPVPLVLDC